MSVSRELFRETIQRYIGSALTAFIWVATDGGDFGCINSSSCIFAQIGHWRNYEKRHRTDFTKYYASKLLQSHQENYSHNVDVFFAPQDAPLRHSAVNPPIEGVISPKSFWCMVLLLPQQLIHVKCPCFLLPYCAKGPCCFESCNCSCILSSTRYWVVAVCLN